MKNTLGVIPARMSSSRFPGKPLESILGIPMLAHCFERALISNSCDHLVIATPDIEILDWANSYQIPVVLTSDDHERATERAAEVIEILETKGDFFEYVLLLQGDEPQINPDDILKLKNAFNEFDSEVINLIFPIKKNEMSDENVVKAIVSSSNKIQFFSRAHIPYESDEGIRQLGMIGFTNQALKLYVNLEMTELEILESIDMMRFLENDIEIQGVFSSSPILGVDRPKDIQKVEEIMTNDTYFHIYKEKYI
ncbi:MAG: 3-deoxy-manno-octulosonate cytidylyltransferase [Gammaproteobacteria bacterium]|nr:3-deoxy-manno-octulosonate cytidylyltransferase [Gammaproteobacteria bacterium]